MLPYRVVDLTDQRGQLCGQLLAALGCEVILVEPPGGAASRRLGPYAGDIESPDTSLWHWAYNRGKQSVVMDLDLSADRERFHGLLTEADILLETAEPGDLDALGLGRDVLAARHPRLVHVSITAFGSDGPKARWAATDLTIAAASGYAWLTGDDDRAPLRIGLPQAFHHAAADAAGATLAALYERDERSGLGQHVDISAQHSFSVCNQSYLLAVPCRTGRASRVAGGVRVSGLDATIQLLWPCQDGQVSVTFLFGSAMGPFTRRLMEWVHEEGFCDEATRDKDWEQYAVMLYDGREPVAEYERVKGVLAAFLATKTKAELYRATFERRVLIAPVTTTEELAASGQLEARRFWHDVDVPGHGSVRFPGPFVKLSATPLPNLAAAGPLCPGARVDWIRPRARPVPYSAPVPAPVPGRPLEGLKVADFLWVFAGPWATRTLADLGATVVRIESSRHLDTLRTAGNFQDENVHPDWAVQFSNVNAGKLGITLDLSRPEAREVALDLVRWADVTTESFTPKTMAAWGLDDVSLRAMRPDLIMASSCLMGHDGPEASLAGFGTMAAAVSGWFNLTGWPDRRPCGPFGAYTDYVAPRFLVVAILAALEHRRRTGEGQYIDLSQAEASLQLMTPAVLDWTVNGRVVQRCGNDDRHMAPHGIYRAAGEDRWVALAVRDDAEWATLCEELGCGEARNWTAQERLANRGELDVMLGRWTGARTAEACEARLQALGIPAHVVQSTVEAFEDPQLRHRGHFVEVPHGAMGTTWVEGSRYRLSRTPAVVERGAPTLNEHGWQVLTEILGYDEDRAADLAGSGVFD